MSTCNTAKTSRRLDEALDQGFPAGDPASLTEPAGDARDAKGCCCNGPAGESPPPAPAAAPKKAGCCGRGEAGA